MDHESQRRAWLLAAAAGAFTPVLAAAASDTPKESDEPHLDPQSVGQKHNDGLDHIRKFLNGAAVNSKPGILALIGALHSYGAISDEEAEILKSMTSAMFAAKSIDEVQSVLKKGYESLSKNGSAAATALSSLAVSSAEYAKQFDKSFGFLRLFIIVSGDFSAGLTAAINCAPVFPALVPFAVLFGAGAASGLALYATMPKIDPVTSPPSGAK